MAVVSSAVSTIDREVGMLDAATAVPGLAAGTLSREQQAVVDHDSGPLLVFAGPGSGKTRTITERIAALIRRGVPAHEILALTFTVRATEEMRVRLIRTLGQDQCQGLTVSTFHGLCSRMLRRHAGRFNRTEKFSIYDETDLRKVLVELVKAHRGDAGDAAEGETLAADVARMTVKAIAMAKCKLVTPAAMREHGEHPERELIAELWELLEGEMRSSDAFDFQDLLTHCVSVLDGHDDIRGVYRARWRHILVDEFQDTDVSQFALLRQLAGPEGCGPDGSLVVVGDDDQCLVRGTLVTMADGTTKPIEKVRVGDMVLAAVGGPKRGPARVAATRRFTNRREGVKLTFASGRTLVSTPEHMHIAGYREGGAPPMHITYLMFREGMGFRVGTSYSESGGGRVPGLRLNHERADCGWVLSTHATRPDAQLAESIAAAKYGLPISPFKARINQNGLSGRQPMIAALYAALDTASGARRLMAEHGLSPAHPHRVAEGHEGRRRHVTVTMTYGRAQHAVSVAGSDPEVAARLREAGYNTRPNRTRKGWRVTVIRADLGEALEHAQRLCDLTDGHLRQIARVGGKDADAKHGRLPLMPASAVRCGMVMATADSSYDTVVACERVVLSDPVYDLDVDCVHNFIAAGLVTHNSVYSFRGAHVGNLLDFQEAFPGARKHLLRRNYRCSRAVLRAAMACIRNNQRRESKALVVRADAPEGSVTRRQFPNEHSEAMAIAREIKARHAAGVPLTEIAALCRTLRHTKTLQQQLTAAHIPHRVIGSHSLWERVEVQDALAYLTLVANPHDAVAFKRAIAAPTDRAQFTAAKVKSLTRGIGDARQKLVVSYAHEHEVDLLEASINAQHINGLGNDARAALVTFGKQLSSIRYDLEFGRSIFHAVIGTLTCDGGPVRCYEHLLANTEDRAILTDTERVLEDLRSLTRAAQTYESEHGEDATLAGFLAEARIEPAEIVKAGEDNRMTVSTIHGAKGTEYRVVYVIACEERVLPHGFALDAADPAALEEERRLAYIAITRAREDVICTTVSERVGDRGDLRRPSRFLAEAGL